MGFNSVFKELIKTATILLYNSSSYTYKFRAPPAHLQGAHNCTQQLLNFFVTIITATLTKSCAFVDLNCNNWIIMKGATRWRCWLRHWATSGKVAGSIPHVVTGIFHWQNPSGRTMVLGSTQPLTEMSTRNICPAVKAAGVCSWQPYHLYVPIVLKSWSLSLLEPSGTLQACNGIGSKLYEVTVVACFKTHTHTHIYI